MTIEQQAVFDILQDAQDYLLNKSYTGDDGGALMNYWDWNVITCAAVGILRDCQNAIYLGDQK